MQFAHKQFDPFLKENVRLSDIFKVINTKLDAFVRCNHNPYDWMRIFELRLAFVYYFGREDLIREFKSEIEYEASHWNKKIFLQNFNRSVEEWKEDLYHRMEDREVFMQQVESNLSLKKISKLKSIHIHDDVAPHKTLLQKIKSFFRLQK